MATVTLIGDSIRMGYQPVVTSELADRADVWGPADNGGDSANVLAHLDAWVLSRPPDVLHINCGLHDLKTPFGQDLRQVPVDAYVENLRTIFERIRRTADTTILWATTTPVNHAWHHAHKGFDRFEEDVLRYNAAAARVTAQFDIPVNDLHAVIEQAGRDTLLVDDGVHYGAEGRERLGQAVAAFIAPYLP